MTLDEFLIEVKNCATMIDVAKLGVDCDDKTIQLRSQAILYYCDILQTAIGNLYESEYEYEVDLMRKVQLKDNDWSEYGHH